MTKKIGYGIGIDTGGTYTDGVLTTLPDHQVVRFCKYPTVHHDLSRGISDVLNDLLTGIDAHQVRQVALSTTLATNAMAEGKGARVALIVAGQIKPFDLPVVSVKYIEGGHDYLGIELKPLDLERLIEVLNDLKGQADAYSVCSEMSIVNPAHEQVIAKAIEHTDSVPVFCSHEVSRKAGVRERAATAVLHARLMPVIKDFTREIRLLTDRMNIGSTISLIRGDATAAELSEAEYRAAATVVSGPAASAYFGAASVSSERSLIVDVGGTTTDLAMIENGKPLISSEGCIIEKWQTHITAVETYTVGIGGDSLVRIDRSGELHVGPARVRPLSSAPEIPDPSAWLGAENRCKCIIAHPGEQDSEPVLNALKSPATPDELIKKLNMPEIMLLGQLERLLFHRQISEAGFTPTDALHVLGELRIGDTKRAVAGAEVLSKLRSQSVEEFCHEVLRKTRDKIQNAISDYLFAKQTGQALGSFAIRSGQNALMNISFSLNIPIIGLGAAARMILPAIAENLKTEVIFPKYYEVGNALGAIMIAGKGEKE